MCREKSAKMDYAQLRVGDHTGKKYQMPTETLERDTTKPIRVTFQGYIVTDSPNLTIQHSIQVIEMLHHMRKRGVAHGSLVVDNSDRLTESVSVVKNSPFKPLNNVGLTPYD